MKRNKYLQNFIYDWPAKVLSLVFAIGIYLFIQYSTIGARVVTIPLDVNLPPSYTAESLVPHSVDIRIKGNDDIIYLIDPDYITARIDFSFVKEAGIATAPVVLEYEENVFNNGGVYISAEPSQFRILFGKKGSSPND
ncbi:hypothetical protein [uncultured Sphaerochaeta sp.]|uniref:hypothetical protein n=1 Tax=uncultured Sphaerochaeta sp. TaxID=886478 RepID=UPI002A0A3469|nr:hypothetical protein [uncultured Sphaerochaeta sp.]